MYAGGFATPAGRPVKTWEVVDGRRSVSADDAKQRKSQAPPHLGGLTSKRGLRTTHSNESAIMSVHSMDPGQSGVMRRSGFGGMWGPKLHDPANQSAFVIPDTTPRNGRQSATPSAGPGPSARGTSPQWSAGLRPSNRAPSPSQYTAKPLHDPVPVQRKAPPLSKAPDAYISRKTFRSEVHEKLYQQAANGNCAGGKYGTRQRDEEVQFRNRLRPDSKRTPVDLSDTSIRSQTAVRTRRSACDWGAGGMRKDAWEWENPYKKQSFVRRKTPNQNQTVFAENGEKEVVWDKLYVAGGKQKADQKQRIADARRTCRDVTKRSKTSTCYDLAYSTFGDKKSRSQLSRTRDKVVNNNRPTDPTQLKTDGNPFDRLYGGRTGHTKPTVLALTEPKPQSFRPKKRIYQYDEKRPPRPWHHKRSHSSHDYSSDTTPIPRSKGERSYSTPPTQEHRHHDHHDHQDRSVSPVSEKAISRVPSLDVARVHPERHQAEQENMRYSYHNSSHYSVGSSDKGHDVTMLDPEEPEEFEGETHLLDETTITESARNHYGYDGFARPPTEKVFDSVNDEVEQQKRRKRAEEEENQRELERLREERDRKSVQVLARVKELEGGGKKAEKPFNFSSIQPTKPTRPAPQSHASEIDQLYGNGHTTTTTTTTSTANGRGPAHRANPPPNLMATPPRVAAHFTPSEDAVPNAYEARDSRPLPKPQEFGMKPNSLVVRANVPIKSSGIGAGASGSTKVAGGGSLWPESDSEEDLAR